MSEEKLSQLQLYEQSLQNLLLQKQQFQAQINEIDSALKELPGANTTYKIIGNIMVKAEKKDLTDDLEAKKSKAELRVKALEKQEKTIKEKAQSLQKEVMSTLEDGKQD